MPRTEPFVIHEEDCELEGWSDPAIGCTRWRTLISGDRTPSGGLTVGVAELEPGDSLTFNFHKHAQVEVYYVLAGEGIVTLSGKKHEVRKGSAIYIPGGVEHAARNIGSQALRLLYVFQANAFSEINYEFPSRFNRG